MPDRKLRVVDAVDVPKEPIKRKSPAELILASLDGDYKVMREMAARYGVHIETMRRLAKTDKVKAPSKAVQSGDMTIYLFTPEDVAEVDEYFSKKGYVIDA